MLCQLPEEKLHNIEALCKELLSKHWGTVELLQKLMGCVNQTRSADVPRQVQRDPEDGSGPLQGQVNHQQAWQLNVSGFTCQPLGFGRTEQHKPVLMIRFEPFVKNPRLYPVLHLVSLDRRLASSDRSLRLIFGSHPNVYSRQSHLLR